MYLVNLQVQLVPLCTKNSSNKGQKTKLENREEEHEKITWCHRLFIDKQKICIGQLKHKTLVIFIQTKLES